MQNMYFIQLKKKYMHKDIGGLTNEESSPEWVEVIFLCIFF